MSPHHIDAIAGTIGGTASILMGIFKFSFDDLHKLWIALIVGIIGGTTAYFVPRFWRWVLFKRTQNQVKEEYKYSKKNEEPTDTDIGKD
jgi:preprotein translocase subunit SecF